MTDRRRRLARAAAVALFCLGWGLTAVILVIATAKHQLGSVDSGGSFQIALACATVGTIVVWHRPEHPMGWILSGIAVFFALDGAGIGLCRARLPRPPRHAAPRPGGGVGEPVLGAGHRAVRAGLPRVPGRRRADVTVALGDPGLFAARLKDTVDANSVTGDLASVVQQALQPASLSVWLRELGQRSELSSHLSAVTGVQAASLPSSRAGSSSVITSSRWAV